MGTAFIFSFFTSRCKQ